MFARMILHKSESSIPIYFTDNCSSNSNFAFGIMENFIIFLMCVKNSHIIEITCVTLLTATLRKEYSLVQSNSKSVFNFLTGCNNSFKN